MSDLHIFSDVGMLENEGPMSRFLSHDTSSDGTNNHKKVQCTMYIDENKKSSNQYASKCRNIVHKKTLI